MQTKQNRGFARKCLWSSQTISEETRWLLNLCCRDTADWKRKSMLTSSIFSHKNAINQNIADLISNASRKSVLNLLTAPSTSTQRPLIQKISRYAT